MNRLPALFRRRTVWLPTALGWSVMLLVLAMLTGLALWRIHPFLALEAPAANAGLLVIEGWMPAEEIEQGLQRYRAGKYRGIVTTGGPVPADLSRMIPASYAELARDHLVRRGLPADSVLAVPTPEARQDRSYLSAVMVRRRLEQSGYGAGAIDVFSSGVHGRRTRSVYRLAFGGDRDIGILVAQPSGYDPELWWSSSAGAKTVLSETVSWLWTLLFFHPDPA